MVGQLTFGLSRALGRDRSFGRARDVAPLIDWLGFSTVLACDSYQTLEHKLLSGEVHAAWAPPIVCARVEQAGGVIALRAIRSGVVEYGAAVLCNGHFGFTAETLPNLTGLRAVWVDEHSMAGYILPRYALRRAGVDLARTFVQQQLVGSYDQCLKMVRDGVADFTSCYYRGSADSPDHGYKALAGRLAKLYRVVLLSEPAPHDGIALSPRLQPQLVDRLRQSFARLISDDRALFAAALDAQGFDEPPPGTYVGLMAMLDQ